MDSKENSVQKPIKVLIVVPENPSGSTFHRVVVPHIYLDEKEFEVVTSPDTAIIPWNEFQDIDVIIASRMVTHSKFEDHPTVIENMVLRYIKESGAKLIIDLDDYPKLPDDFRLAKRQNKDGTPEAIIRSIQNADAVWTTNDRLQKEILAMLTSGRKKAKVKKPVQVIRNGISDQDQQWTTEKMDYSDLRIGLSCMDNHWPDLERLKPVLKKLNEVSGWRIMAMGCDITYKKEIAKRLGTERITFIPWVTPYEYALQYKKIDVMLCPLRHNRYNNCRSDIKFAEAAFSNTPVIAENFGPYKGHKCAVDDWGILETLVKDYLDGKKGVFDKFRITDKENYGVDKPNEIRIKTIKRLADEKRKVQADNRKRKPEPERAEKPERQPKPETSSS